MQLARTGAGRTLLLLGADLLVAGRALELARQGFPSPGFLKDGSRLANGGTATA